MGLFDAFLASVIVYFMTVLLFRLQGSDKFKGLSLMEHFLVMLPIWMFLTFATVCNATEKSTKILGTIILVVGAVILYLGFFTNTFRSFGKSADLARMILKYKGADDVSMMLQRGMPLYEMEKIETVGENADGNMTVGDDVRRVYQDCYSRRLPS